MATYEFYGYSPEALVFDPTTGQFTLDPDFKASQDRVLFEVTDNDTLFDGDRSRDEVGEDSNQRAVVTDNDGNDIAEGRVYVEEFGYLTGPDGSMTMIDTIEINGIVVGYVTNQPLKPGTTWDYTGARDVDNNLNGSDTRLGFDYYVTNSVPCFGPGTMIATTNGEVPVEWLETGDMLLTRDRSYQPILWIGRTTLPRYHFEQFRQDIPVCIPAGTLGNNVPSHDLEVTGDHRLLIRSLAAELMFSASEVFAPAKAWPGAGLATRRLPDTPYTLTHILCPSHEVIMANGAWVESMFPGPETLRRLSPADRARVTGLLGPDYAQTQTARRCLTFREAVSLLGLQRKPAGEVMALNLARSA